MSIKAGMQLADILHNPATSEAESGRSHQQHTLEPPELLSLSEKIRIIGCDIYRHTLSLILQVALSALIIFCFIETTLFYHPARDENASTNAVIAINRRYPETTLHYLVDWSRIHVVESLVFTTMAHTKL